MSLSRNIVRARELLVEKYRELFGYPVLRDVFKAGQQGKKRALLIYMVSPFLSGADDPRSANHQNWWQNRAIAEVLNGMGYVVDVIDRRDVKFRPETKYDALIGLGPATLRMAQLLDPSTRSVFIMTGSEPGFHNRQEEARRNAVTERRGCALQCRRYSIPLAEHLHLFDGIACIGNKQTLSTFDGIHDRLYPYNNTVPAGVQFVEKDYNAARKHFLYFASGGQVHRGLDLLLETFANQNDLHLHVCSPFSKERDFARCYNKELFDTPNIHAVGWTSILSPRFSELCRRCAFTILPSCAEGQAGAVLTCMGAGLIPIISRECGIDEGQFGILLPSCSIDDIRTAVTDASQMPADRVEDACRLAQSTAAASYSENAFKERWQEILGAVLGEESTS